MLLITPNHTLQSATKLISNTICKEEDWRESAFFVDETKLWNNLPRSKATTAQVLRSANVSGLWSVWTVNGQAKIYWK